MEWVLPLQIAINQIAYKDWDIIVNIDEGIPYLQIQFDANAFNVDSPPDIQYCRKWLLYPTMNASEAVKTAWMAIMAAEEHEARERFRYKGRRIYAPHFDVDQMAEFARHKENIAVTDDPI